jgi:hypothetical protein
MKNNKIIKSIFAIVMIFLMSNCNKKSPSINSIVPITQNGANTFACKINGTVVYTKTRENSLSTEGIGVMIFPYQFTLSAITSSPRNDFFFIVKYDGTIGIFPVFSWSANNSEYNHVRLFTDVDHSGNISGGSNTCVTNDSTMGYIQITKNNSKVFAGTFNFDMNASNNTVVHITEGRFDFEKR